MPIINQRTDTEVYAGGSDLLQVYFDAADVTAYDEITTEGWHTLSYQKGGTVGPELTEERINSEAGVLVKTTTTQNEVIITNAMLQSSDYHIKLLRTILPAKNRKYRYFLPLDEVATKYQLWGLWAARTDKDGFQMSTEEGAIRELPFTVRGGADDDGNIETVVDLDDINTEGGWPAAAAAFLTDDTQWPT